MVISVSVPVLKDARIASPPVPGSPENRLNSIATLSFTGLPLKSVI
jgi:hypothetical protein